MNRRERLERCYRGEETDRPAVYSRAGFPANDPTYDELRAYLAAHTELKGGWNAGQVQAPWPFASRTEPATADFDRVVTGLETPAGLRLESSFLASRKGQPGLHETYLLKDEADAEAWLSLPLPALGGAVDGFAAAVANLGDTGIVETHLGFNPGGFVAELFGSEMFAIMTVTNRDLVHALCNRYMQILRRRVDYLLAQGVGPFFAILGQEYIVPPLHGPRDFTDFNVRYDKPILDRIHEAGGRVHVHSHGSIKTVFDGFLAMGADVLHPIEAPPLGDMTAAEAKARARGRLCIEGNLQIADLYESTPDAIRAQTEALIADAFDDHRGLIVCPTASPYIRGAGHTCFPMYKAMIDTVLATAP